MASSSPASRARLNPSASSHPWAATILVALGLFLGVLGNDAPANASTDMPLGALLDPSAWPANSPIDGVEGIFAALRIEGLTLRESPDSELELSLGFTGGVDLTLPSLGGFGLVLGASGPDTDNTLQVTYRYGSSPQALTLKPNADGGTLLELHLPLFTTPEGGPAVIAVQGAVEADSEGNLLIAGLSLSEVELLDGLTLSLADVVLDLHDAQGVPGMAIGWQGVLLGQVVLTLPESLGGLTVTGHDITIDDDGVTGSLSGSLPDGGNLALGPLTITSLAATVSLNDGVQVTSVAGMATLPAELLPGCDGTAGGLSVGLSYQDGKVTGVIDLSDPNLPEGCRQISAGDGFTLTLGASVTAVGCDDHTPTEVTTANRVRVTVDTDHGDFALEGFSNPDLTEAAPLGALEVSDNILTPVVPGSAILLPDRITISSDGVCVGCATGADPGQGLQIPPMRIGESEATLCAEQVVLDLDENLAAWAEGEAPTGFNAQGGPWKGLYAQSLTVEIPTDNAPIKISGKALALGTDGSLGGTLAVGGAGASPTQFAIFDGLTAILGDPTGAATDITVGYTGGTFTLNNAGGGHTVAIRLPDSLSAPGESEGALLSVESLVINDAGHFRLGPIGLSPTTIGDTGVVVTTEIPDDALGQASCSVPGVYIDHDPGATEDALCPLVTTDGGDCAGWTGVVVGSLAVDLPDDFGGVDAVRACGFVIDGNGVSGHVEADLSLSGTFAGLDGTLTEVCLDIDHNVPSLCGLAGQVELPPDTLGCADGEPLLVNMAWNDDGFTGVVDVTALDAGCRTLSLGLEEGGVTLGGGPVQQFACDQQDPIGAVTPARFLQVHMSTQGPFSLSLTGYSTDPTENTAATLAPVGVLRLGSDLLRPVRGEDGILLPSSVVFGDDGVCIGCGDGDGGLSMPPMEVGTTGVEICAQDLRLDLHDTLNAWDGPSDQPDGLGQGGAWKGLYATSMSLWLPFEAEDGTRPLITAQNLAIGTDGLTGTIDAPIPTLAYSGFAIEDLHVGLGFVRSQPTDVDVTGRLTVPFFDQPVDVDFGLDGQGGWSVALSATDPAGVTLDKNMGSVHLRATFLRLEVSCDDGDCAVTVDCTLGIGTAVFDTGDITLEGLRISSTGELDLDGGYYQFAEPKVISFAGFSYALSGIGAGTRENGRRWLTLGGVFQLQDVLPVSAEVHDVGVSWEDGFVNPALEVSGIKLSMEVPGVLTVAGGLRWCEAGMPSCGGGSDALGSKWFEGEVEVAVHSPPFNIKGRLMVGKADAGWTFWYVQIDAQLPTGIPLGATNVSIYGFSGGFGKNVQLNLRQDYPRGLNLQNPILPRHESFVFMAGVTVGTAHDNGFTLNSDVRLFVQVPGPVILFNGQAWLFTERAQRTGDPNLTIDILFDFIRKEFSFSLAAQYKIDRETGFLLDAGGGFEVLLGKDKWHLYLGTRAQPIRAELLRFAEADSYLMFGNDLPPDDKTGFIVGAHIKVGWEGSALGGWVGLGFGLYAGGELSLQMEPKQVMVGANLGGYAKIWAGPFKLGMDINASFEGQAPRPFNLAADLTVTVFLPWPFPDIDLGIGVSWPDDDEESLLPLSPPIPVKELVLQSESTGRTVTLYDQATTTMVDPPAVDLTDVPFDSLGEITFSRRVDCRGTDTVYPCGANHCDPPCAEGSVCTFSGCAPHPAISADLGSESYFTDVVGACKIRHSFEGLNLEGDGEDVAWRGGWGGSLGAAESGWSQDRRFEAFTFRPVKWENQACAEPTDAPRRDPGHVQTTIPTTCRALRTLDTCWDVNDPDQPTTLSAEDARFEGRFIDPSQTLWYDAQTQLAAVGDVVSRGTLGVGLCGGGLEPPGTTVATSAPSAIPGSFIPLPPDWAVVVAPPVACCLPTGVCAPTSGGTCKDVGGVMVPSCEGTITCGGGCCADTLHPIACKGDDGDHLVPDYLMDDDGALWQVRQEGTKTKVGLCIELPDQTDACPSDDVNLCADLGASDAVVCHLFDGTLIAPSEAQVDRQQGYTEAVDFEIPPGAPLCPGRTYTLDFQTVTTASLYDGPDPDNPDQPLPDVVREAGCTMDATPVTRSEAITFTVEPMPQDLTPYVAWTTPAPSEAHVYRSHDVVMQFKTATLCDVFGCCGGLDHELMIELRLADAPPGAPSVAGAVARHGCGAEPTETIETLWPTLWVERVAPGEPVGLALAPVLEQRGDFVAFVPDTPLAPETRYVATIPHPGSYGSCGGPGDCAEGERCVDGACTFRPYASFSFTTSQFETFTAAVSGAQAYVRGDTVFLETAEALDWRHLHASFDGSPITDRRVSDDHSAVHVFSLDGENLDEGTLTLSYRSLPHRPCLCDDDSGCPGGGSCVEGVCVGGDSCSPSQCQTGGCGPTQSVLRRNTTEIHEVVSIPATGGP